MSPLEIKILLHYSWSDIDYDQTADVTSLTSHGPPPAVCLAIIQFIDEGLLEARYGDLNWAVFTAPFIESHNGSPIERPLFTITDKGRAMVEHLCAVKIPVCKWVQPEATS